MLLHPGTERDLRRHHLADHLTVARLRPLGAPASLPAHALRDHGGRPWVPQPRTPPLPLPRRPGLRPTFLLINAGKMPALPAGAAGDGVALPAANELRKTYWYVTTSCGRFAVVVRSAAAGEGDRQSPHVVEQHRRELRGRSSEEVELVGRGGLASSRCSRCPCRQLGWRLGAVADVPGQPPTPGPPPIHRRKRSSGGGPWADGATARSSRVGRRRRPGHRSCPGSSALPRSPGPSNCRRWWTWR